MRKTLFKHVKALPLSRWDINSTKTFEILPEKNLPAETTKAEVLTASFNIDSGRDAQNKNKIHKVKKESDKLFCLRPP